MGYIKIIDLFFLDCKPSKLWLYSRHETRFPSDSDIQAMIEFLPSLQDVVQNSTSKFFLKL